MKSHLIQYLVFLLWLVQGSLAEYGEDVLNWEAPIEMREAFPYALNGVDDSGNPVWYMTFGQWDIRWLTEGEGGHEFLHLWPKYGEQMYRRMYASAKNKTITSMAPKGETSGESDEKNENSVEGFILINNNDKYSHRQFLHPPTVKLTLEFFQILYNLEKTQGYPGMQLAFNVNVNFAGRSLWTVISSQLGPFATKFELYGTNVNKWKHELAKRIPKRLIPPGMGGPANFKPLEVFG